MPAEAFLPAALIPNDLLTNVFSQIFSKFPGISLQIF